MNNIGALRTGAPSLELATSAPVCSPFGPNSSLAVGWQQVSAPPFGRVFRQRTHHRSHTTPRIARSDMQHARHDPPKPPGVMKGTANFNA